MASACCADCFIAHSLATVKAPVRNQSQLLWKQKEKAEICQLICWFFLPSEQKKETKIATIHLIALNDCFVQQRCLQRVKVIAEILLTEPCWELTSDILQGDRYAGSHFPRCSKRSEAQLFIGSNACRENTNRNEPLPSPYWVTMFIAAVLINPTIPSFVWCHDKDAYRDCHFSVTWPSFWKIFSSQMCFVAQFTTNLLLMDNSCDLPIEHKDHNKYLQVVLDWSEKPGLSVWTNQCRHSSSEAVLKPDWLSRSCWLRLQPPNNILFRANQNGRELTHNPCTFDQQMNGITWQEGHWGEKKPVRGQRGTVRTKTKASAVYVPIVSTSCLLTRKRWCQCWPLHKLIQGCRCPWLRCPDWRQTCRTKSFRQTERIEWVCFWSDITAGFPQSIPALTSVKRTGFFPSALGRNSSSSCPSTSSYLRAKREWISDLSERRRWRRTNLDRRTWASGRRFWTTIQQVPRAKTQGRDGNMKPVKFDHCCWGRIYSLISLSDTRGDWTGGAGAAMLAAVCVWQ